MVIFLNNKTLILLIIVFFRLKIASLGLAWTCQVVRSPKFIFHFRKFCYDGEWETVKNSILPLITEVDALLNSFYDGRFTSASVNAKMNKLDANFKAALKKHLPENVQYMLVRKCPNNPKARPNVIDAAVKVLGFDFALLTDDTKFRELEILLCENNGRSLNIIPDEEMFQTTLVIKSVHLADGIPQIKEHGLVNEQFTGSKTCSMAELFSSGLAKRIYDEISPHLWSFFLANLINEEDQSLVYPTVLKMVRKNYKPTNRLQIIDLCPIMIKVNPRFHEDQYLHLLECDSCRLVISNYDFHSISTRDQSRALDYFTKTLIDGCQSYLDKTYKWNNCPFVDENNVICPSGGFVCAPGKGSHAFQAAGNGFVRMKESAGTRNAAVFSMMIFLSPCNAAKGEFFISFRQMYKDAHLYLTEFSANGGNSTVRRYWNMMNASIVRILRFYPSNILPAEALNACEKVFNNDIWRYGKVKFCYNCTDFHNCAVNKQVYEFLKARIIISIVIIIICCFLFFTLFILKKHKIIHIKSILLWCMLIFALVLKKQSNS